MEMGSRSYQELGRRGNGGVLLNGCSWPSVSVSSASVNSTNCGSKIFEKKKRDVAADVCCVVGPTTAASVLDSANFFLTVIPTQHSIAVIYIACTLY